MIQGYPRLVVIGLVMSMVSAYYYLRVVLVMYRDEPPDPTPITVFSPVTLTLVIAVIATPVIGFYPGVAGQHHRCGGEIVLVLH